MPVRFCGHGATGNAIAEPLLAQGYRLTVWNRTAGRAAVLVARGATHAVLVARGATQATTPPIKFNFAYQLRPTGGARKKLARRMSPLMADFVAEVRC